MDQNSTNDRPLKRLRLGTRSCAECRRRKVRCIFGPDKKTCNECALHVVDCIPQGQKKPRGPESPSDDKDVHEKLANLEEMVRRIWSTMDFQTESPTPSQIEFNTAEVLKRITQQTSSNHGSEYGSISGSGSRSEPNTPGTSISTRTVSDPFADAPLLNLFRDAMLIQDVEVQSSAAKIPYDHRLASCVKTFQSLLPRSDDLNAILSATQIFWRVWQDAQGLSLGEKDSLQSVRTAYMYIQKSLHSRQPASVAKAVLFLALCVQQVTNQVANEILTPTTRSKMSLDPYIILVDMLLSISENSMPTIEGLECLEILAKLYMNMGKPRESWLSIRRGINLALLLRLHHTDERSMMRERKIWSHLWQTDRQLSMVLGLPAATTDFHPGLGRVIAGDHIAEPVMYQMSVIAGHISERNQNSAATDYYRTIQIDQEIRTMLQRIPSEWWNAQSNESTPVEMVYGLQVLKIQLYMLQKNLHQPYMLKSFTNSDYEPSNSTACDASREMIFAYQTLRQHPKVGFIICDLMDFQVFTAAVVLVINLLWSPAPRNYRHESDWKLIQSVTDILKKVAESMSCNVASQASQILEYLAAAHNGTYTGPQQFEAVIPYFGQVKINRFFPRNQIAQPDPNTISYQMDNSMQAQYSPSTIDFAANSFAPFGWDTQEFFAGAELGIDWTSLPDERVSYDWSQHFDCSQMGQQLQPQMGVVGGPMFGDGSPYLVV